MKIITRFEVPEWNNTMIQKTLAFWKQRGFDLTKHSPGEYLSHRGSLFGNFYSMNMSKISADLSIRVEGNSITCMYDIPQFLHRTIKFKRKYFELELETYESVLLNDHYLTLEWQQYEKSVHTRKVISLSLVSAFFISAFLFMR